MHFLIFAVGSVLVVPAGRSQSAKPTSSSPANAAPADSAHDLSGVWVEKNGQSSSFLIGAQQEPPLTAWGKAQFKAQFRAIKSAEAKKPGAVNTSDPHSYCDPLGMPRADLTKKPVEIVQTSDEVYIFYEEDHSWRQVYMDGRPLPDSPDSSYLGYSVGRWDGDTLVVDTAGLNDKTWLDEAGHPHSEALRVTERIRRTGPDTLQLSLTFEDAKAYTKSWTSAPRIFERKRGYELTEDYCVTPDNLGERKATAPAAEPATQSK